MKTDFQQIAEYRYDFTPPREHHTVDSPRARAPGKAPECLRKQGLRAQN